MPTSRRRSPTGPDHDHRQLAARLGHAFARPELMEQALTHRSAGRAHNERLEFLGDAILGYLVTTALCVRHPGEREGTLTRARARLVRRETLAEIARELGLGPLLVLGAGERRSGGRERDSILADALEALIGAVHQDAGIEAARAVVDNLFGPRLATPAGAGEGKDPKTRLQELVQARRLALPEYAVAEVTGTSPQEQFTVRCRVPALDVTETAVGSSRRQAEQIAAARVLDRLSPDRDAGGAGRQGRGRG